MTHVDQPIPRVYCSLCVPLCRAPHTSQLQSKAASKGLEWCTLAAAFCGGPVQFRPELRFLVQAQFSSTAVRSVSHHAAADPGDRGVALSVCLSGLSVWLPLSPLSLSPFLTHSHSCSLPHTHSHSFTQCLSLSLSLSLSVSLCLSLSLSLSHSIPLPFSLSLSLYLSHSLSLSLSFSVYVSLSSSLSVSLCLSLTHSLSLSLPLSLAFTLSLYCSRHFVHHVASPSSGSKPWVRVHHACFLGLTSTRGRWRILHCTWQASTSEATGTQAVAPETMATKAVATDFHPGAEAAPDRVPNPHGLLSSTLEI